PPAEPGAGPFFPRPGALDPCSPVAADPAGMEANAVLALERCRERRRDVVELRPVAERVLERGQRGERIRRSWKDRSEPRGVDAEQDRAVLDEGAPVAPL